MKRVLVTGASGFIGRQALPLLVDAGFEVHAISLGKDHPSFAHVNWHQTDLRKKEDRKKVMVEVKPTHVLHFAWIATPSVYWTSPLNEEWLEATRDLLALSKENGVTRFVGAGSCAEYDWSAGLCDEMKTPLNPMTPYGKAKAAAGTSVIDEKGMSTAWGRIFHLYGPHEHTGRLVPAVIVSLLDENQAQCTYGKQIRDFLHVSDVASAFVALLQSDVRGAVNIASGIPVTIGDVVLEIADQLKKTNLVQLGALPSPKDDPPRITATIERLHKEVGWKPSLSLQQGIADTIDWWKAHR